MVNEDSQRILEYLKKQGSANTFKLSRELGMERYKLLDIIKRLEEKQAVEVKSGTVNFLKFPVKEKKAAKKKPIKIKEVVSKPKRIRFKIRSNILKTLQDENKKLREGLMEFGARIKKQKALNIKKIKEQAEYIEKQEKGIRELEKKAMTPPKIITKTIINKVPVKVKEEKEKIETKVKKFKMPKINFSALDKLNKKIQQLNVPDILRK